MRISMGHGLITETGVATIIRRSSGWIDEFNMTNDEAKRQELASNIQKTLLIDMPIIPFMA